MKTTFRTTIIFPGIEYWTQQFLHLTTIAIPEIFPIFIILDHNEKRMNLKKIPVRVLLVLIRMCGWNNHNHVIEWGEKWWGERVSLTHTSDISSTSLEKSSTFLSIRNKFSGGNTLYRRKKVSENLNQSLIISIPMKRKLFREETVPTQIGIFDGAYQRLMWRNSGVQYTIVILLILILSMFSTNKKEIFYLISKL